jgi:hypothetical protein
MRIGLFTLVISLWATSCAAQCFDSCEHCPPNTGCGYDTQKVRIYLLAITETDISANIIFSVVSWEYVLILDWLIANDLD